MKPFLAFGLAAGLLIAGCSVGENPSAGIYVLLDTAENHSRGQKNATEVIQYLLQILTPSDTLAAASIGTASFSGKEIIASVTFDQRPSVANKQKRAFRNRFDHFVRSAEDSPFTDISGGIIQAIDFLNKTGPGRKSILILSNLRHQPAGGSVRDIPFQLEGIHVVILEAHGLQPGSRDLKNYLRRMENWRTKVESDNGRWHVIDEVQQLESILRPDPGINGG